MKAALALLLRLPVAIILAVGVATLVSVAWFFPWVFVFHLGGLVYFPYEPDGVSRYARLAGPFTSAWVPGEKIPDACRRALVASEDAKFFYHNGLDLESMRESYEANQSKGEIRRGGSTVTQQLVKNTFLSRDKSYLRKLREVAGALLADATLSKEDQLAWYFNIVEFGPRVYGIGPAAQFYFKKEASALTSRECAALVAVLPSPNKWNASLLKKRYTAFFSRRVGTISARMAGVKLGVDEEVKRALAKERTGLSISQSARLAADQVKAEKEAAAKTANGGEDGEGGGGEAEGAGAGTGVASPFESVPGAPAGLGGTGTEGDSEVSPGGSPAIPPIEEGGFGNRAGGGPSDTPALPPGLLPDRDAAPPSGLDEPVEAPAGTERAKGSQ